MDKYAKLFKGLELCAGPDCSADCPYHGETRGGKTCRAWLLTDALTAILTMEGENHKLNEDITCIIQHRDDLAADKNALATANGDLREENRLLHERCQVQQNEINALVLKLGEVKAQEPAPKSALTEAAKVAMRAVKDAEYWHGQADALKWCLHGRFEDCMVEGCADVEPPEAEATGHV